MQTIRTFSTVREARDYRHENGAGGWIFADDSNSIVILFPPDMAPSNIFHHQMTRGLSGRLLAS